MENKTETITSVSLDSSLLQIEKNDSRIIVRKGAMKCPDAILGYTLVGFFSLVFLMGLLAASLIAYAAIDDTNNRYALLSFSVFFILLSIAPLYGIGIYSGIIFSYTRWIDFKDKKFKASKFGLIMFGRFLETDIRLIVQPMYSRGAWGSVFTIESAGKRYELFSLGITGSESEARRQAVEIMTAMKQKFSLLELSIDEASWQKNRERKL